MLDAQEIITVAGACVSLLFIGGLGVVILSRLKNSV